MRWTRPQLDAPPSPSPIVSPPSATPTKSTSSETEASWNKAPTTSSWPTPTVPTAQLVSAQKLKGRDPDSRDSEEAGEDGLMSAKEVEETLAEQVPEALKRTGTGRSLASEALERKRWNKEKRRDLMAWFILSRGWLCSTGTIGNGLVYPAFGIVSGKAMDAFSLQDRHELRFQGDRNALWYYVLLVPQLVHALRSSFPPGTIRLRVELLKDQTNKAAHEESAQLACEAAGAVRTFQSLTREEDCFQEYSRSLDEPLRRSNKSAVWSTGLFALSQATSFFAISLSFW
ncbi:GTPase-activating protein [Tulasnella sp. 408]|nr:GTPase-activating protein [Tulasnella sp. 408]